jgi:hypothetical protein
VTFESEGYENAMGEATHPHKIKPIKMKQSLQKRHRITRSKDMSDHPTADEILVENGERLYRDHHNTNSRLANVRSKETLNIK